MDPLDISADTCESSPTDGPSSPLEVPRKETSVANHVASLGKQLSLLQQKVDTMSEMMLVLHLMFLQQQQQQQRRFSKHSSNTGSGTDLIFSIPTESHLSMAADGTIPKSPSATTEAGDYDNNKEECNPAFSTSDILRPVNRQETRNPHDEPACASEHESNEKKSKGGAMNELDIGLLQMFPAIASDGSPLMFENKKKELEQKLHHLVLRQHLLQQQAARMEKPGDLLQQSSLEVQEQQQSSPLEAPSQPGRSGKKPVVIFHEGLSESNPEKPRKDSLSGSVSPEISSTTHQQLPLQKARVGTRKSIVSVVSLGETEDTYSDDGRRPTQPQTNGNTQNGGKPNAGLLGIRLSDNPTRSSSRLSNASAYRAHPLLQNDGSGFFEGASSPTGASSPVRRRRRNQLGENSHSFNPSTIPNAAASPPPPGGVVRRRVRREESATGTMSAKSGDAGALNSITGLISQTSAGGAQTSTTGETKAVARFTSAGQLETSKSFEQIPLHIPDGAVTLESATVEPNQPAPAQANDDIKVVLSEEYESRSMSLPATMDRQISDFRSTHADTMDNPLVKAHLRTAEQQMNNPQSILSGDFGSAAGGGAPASLKISGQPDGRLTPSYPGAVDSQPHEGGSRTGSPYPSPKGGKNRKHRVSFDARAADHQGTFEFWKSAIDNNGTTTENAAKTPNLDGESSQEIVQSGAPVSNSTSLNGSSLEKKELVVPRTYTEDLGQSSVAINEKICGLIPVPQTLMDTDHPLVYLSDGFYVVASLVSASLGVLSISNSLSTFNVYMTPPAGLVVWILFVEIFSAFWMVLRGKYVRMITGVWTVTETHAEVTYYYLRSWFALDSIVTFPVELIFIIGSATSSYSADWNYGFYLCFLRHCLRVLRIFSLLPSSHPLLPSRPMMTFFVMVGLLMFMMVLFGTVFSYMANVDIISSLYFSVTMTTTTGFGDFVPNTSDSKLFFSVGMLVSFFLLSLIQAYSTSILTHRDSVTEQMQEQKRTMHGLLKFYDVPWALQTAVLAAFPATLDSQREAKFKNIIGELPPVIGDEISQYFKAREISQLKIFSNFFGDSDNVFYVSTDVNEGMADVGNQLAHKLARDLVVRSVTTGEWILREGDRALELFIWQTGMADVIETEGGATSKRRAIIKKIKSYKAQLLLQQSSKARQASTNNLLVTEADFLDRALDLYEEFDEENKCSGVDPLFEVEDEYGEEEEVVELTLRKGMAHGSGGLATVADQIWTVGLQCNQPSEFYVLHRADYREAERQFPKLLKSTIVVPTIESESWLKDANEYLEEQQIWSALLHRKQQQRGGSEAGDLLLPTGSRYGIANLEAFRAFDTFDHPTPANANIEGRKNSFSRRRRQSKATSDILMDQYFSSSVGGGTHASPKVPTLEFASSRRIVDNSSMDGPSPVYPSEVLLEDGTRYFSGTSLHSHAHGSPGASGSNITGALRLVGSGSLLLSMDNENRRQSSMQQQHAQIPPIHTSPGNNLSSASSRSSAKNTPALDGKKKKGVGFKSSGEPASGEGTPFTPPLPRSPLPQPHHAPLVQKENEEERNNSTAIRQANPLVPPATDDRNAPPSAVA